jgi:hypothetical protein
MAGLDQRTSETLKAMATGDVPLDGLEIRCVCGGGTGPATIDLGWFTARAWSLSVSLR